MTIAKIKFQPAKGNPEQKKGALANVRANIKRAIPRFKQGNLKWGKWVIVGGGPSVKNDLEEIRALYEEPQNVIVCVNRAHDWLIENGIIPRYCVLFEVAPDVRSLYKKPHPWVQYLIASHCDVSAFEHLKDYQSILWHAWCERGEDKIVAELDPGQCLIGGGSTSALRSLTIGMVAGYRDFEMFGVDSSYEKGTHVYHDLPPDYFLPMHVWMDDRHYKTAPYLAKQTDEFCQWCKLHGEGLSMMVHGKGLLPAAFRKMYPEEKSC